MAASKSIINGLQSLGGGDRRNGIDAGANYNGCCVAF
jgi:hypothetical protein